MSLGAAELVADAKGWRILRHPGPNLAAALLGRPVDEVAMLLPRIFNLCRMAQSGAAQLSLGLTDAPEDTTPEVIRDHLAQVFVILRRAFGLAPLTPPAAASLADLFGPAQSLPRDRTGLQAWLTTETPAADLIRAVQSTFPAKLGQTPALPLPNGGEAGAFENSAAGRQSDHPLLQAIESHQSRSPLWRALGLLADLESALLGRLPKPRLANGTAIVQAARGAYALRLTRADGRVTALHRVTPTDHQLAAGGALELALQTLPATRPDLAARLVALFDPCIPVRLPEVHHA
jgi:hypothetical protein